MPSRRASLLRHLAPLLLTLICTSARAFDAAGDLPTVAHKTTGMQHMGGLFPLDWDAKSGHMYVEIVEMGREFLFLDSLPYGLGSNDVGLDRGQLGQSRVVRFERNGPKVLLVQSNYAYRSSSENPEDRIATRESFAESVLWGFSVVAEEPGRILVDATDFYLHDQHGISESLQTAHQGAYKLDGSRSAITLEGSKNFPLNTEVESILTFTTEDRGPRDSFVAEVTPDPHSITLREHYSFIQLPGAGYTPRAFDPRSGYFDMTYRDESAPLGAPLEVRLISRHRLIKKNPEAAISDPVIPIVYYVDRGAPEPIRSALIEGASWWNQAFKAAGFKNAFRVEVLPEGADPMDIRYNMIQWVHRSTRGWSYGESVVDPRTGEIIKGQVTLGSLRPRQDYLIAEALLSPYVQGKPVTNEMREMVLARIRQLAAHETGHTLGLAHNFAASSIAPGTSVMDYPAPYVTLDPNGRPDLSHAYAVGIGAWDKVAIEYGYSQFPGASPQAERSALNNVLDRAQKQGLYFITDEDARPLGSVHPYSHLWDHGHDPADELDRILEIRAAALKRFGEDAIPAGTPFAQLEDTLVPLYLLHRYQVEAASKELGGVDYRYALRGDGQFVTQMVSPQNQRHALASLLKTLDPQVLTLPESLLKLLPPRPPGYPRSRESFPSEAGLAFDPVATAQSAADLTLSALLEPTRAQRLVENTARDPQEPSLGDVLEGLISSTWKAAPQTGLTKNIQHAIQLSATEHMLALAADPNASDLIRAIVRQHIEQLKPTLAGMRSAPAQAARARIENFEQHPESFKPVPPIATPPGAPIGSDD